MSLLAQELARVNVCVCAGCASVRVLPLGVWPEPSACAVSSNGELGTAIDSGACRYLRITKPEALPAEVAVRLLCAVRNFHATEQQNQQQAQARGHAILTACRAVQLVLDSTQPAEPQYASVAKAKQALAEMVAAHGLQLGEHIWRPPTEEEAAAARERERSGWSWAL